MRFRSAQIDIVPCKPVSAPCRIHIVSLMTENKYGQNAPPCNIYNDASANCLRCMSSQSNHDQWILCFVFFKVKLKQRNADSHVALYCIGKEDAVHVSIVIGKQRSSMDGITRLELMPWELSAWNGRMSSICPLTSSSNPNYTPHEKLLVYACDVLYMPVKNEIIQAMQKILMENTEEPALHVPKLDNTTSVPSVSDSTPKFEKMLGWKYPASWKMATDFVNRSWRSYQDLTAPSVDADMVTQHKAFEQTGAQCAQLSVCILLQVLDNDRRLGGSLNVSNYHVNALRRLLHDNGTSLHPQNVLEVFTMVSDGQPGIDCDQMVHKLFQRASLANVEMRWCHGGVIKNVEDIVVPDPWQYCPALPTPFMQ